LEQPAKPTIVVAEEYALVREGIAALCESTGVYQVAGHCGDGAALVEMAWNLAPDLVVADMVLPKLDALEAIHKLRRHGNTSGIVALSTRGDRKTVLEVLRGGANAFVLKSGPGRHLLDAFTHIREGGIYVSPLLELEKIFVSQKKGDEEDPMDRLSTREYQVFALLIDGVRAKEIAARLELSPKTVDTYRASLMRKLDIHDVAGLVKFAIHRNLTSAT
jgi:DNA-binding NarL/FixJ family response regulator